MAGGAFFCLSRNLVMMGIELPQTTVVTMTRHREVVMMTSQFGNESSILSTSPKAIAPLIMPATYTKMVSLKVISRSCQRMNYMLKVTYTDEVQ